MQNSVMNCGLKRWIAHARYKSVSCFTSATVMVTIWFCILQIILWFALWAEYLIPASKSVLEHNEWRHRCRRLQVPKKKDKSFFHRPAKCDYVGSFSEYRLKDDPCKARECRKVKWHGLYGQDLKGSDAGFKQSYWNSVSYKRFSRSRASDG